MEVVVLDVAEIGEGFLVFGFGPSRTNPTFGYSPFEFGFAGVASIDRHHDFGVAFFIVSPHYITGTDADSASGAGSDKFTVF